MHIDPTGALGRGAQRLVQDFRAALADASVTPAFVERFSVAVLAPSPVDVLPPDPVLVRQRLDELVIYRVGPAGRKADELLAHGDDWLGYLAYGSDHLHGCPSEDMPQDVDVATWLLKPAWIAARQALYAAHPAFTPLFQLVKALTWSEAMLPERHDDDLAWAVVECRAAARALARSAADNA